MPYWIPLTTLAFAVLRPVPSRVAGTVLAVFPAQSEAVVKVSSRTSPGGKTITFDPPRAKRLLLSGLVQPIALVPGASICAEGTDLGRARPLKVDRLEMGETLPGPEPEPPTPTLLPIPETQRSSVTLADGTRVEGRRLLTLEATGYGPGENGRWGDRTKLGTKVGYGTVAVDPRVIPLRTHLWVEGYGFCIALDVGSAIKGRRIDLGHDDDVTANLYGRQKVRVLILD